MNKLFERKIKKEIEAELLEERSILLLGPRQTGKTTLVKQLPHDRYINLMDAVLFYQYKDDPVLFINQMRALSKQIGGKPTVIIDEIQKIPELTDSCQVLIDEGEVVFVITSSSARKIKNLLPGRVSLFKMSTMLYAEQNLDRGLSDVLTNGSLPKTCLLTDQKKIDRLLQEYVALYLEEEVRKEALVRNLGSFVNFLKLACIESGNILNMSAISQQIGVAHKTVQEYYRILEDCLLVRRIDPLLNYGGSRRKLTKSVRYILFDLGLRRIGAVEGVQITLEQQGRLLEQYVGIELATLIESQKKRALLLYWRDHDGPEVDYVIETEGRYIPVEVKLTKKPTQKDIKHLKVFRAEYNVVHCYLVADVQYPYEIEQGIMVIPWRMLHMVLD